MLRGGRADRLRLPHTVFWHNHPRWRRAPLYATQRSCAAAAHTTTIGPPLLPFAWERVAAASSDEPGFATESVHALGRTWTARRERDVDGDGLISIILPDESGLGDSPEHDPVYGAYAHYKPGYFRLVARYGRLGWSAHEIAAVHDEHVEDVWVNVAYALSWRHGAPRRRRRVRAACGRRRGGARFSARSIPPRACSRPRRARRAPSGVDWSSLSPLMLDTCPRMSAGAWSRSTSWTPAVSASFGIPSGDDEPSFRPGFDLWRTWRASWMNVAWLLTRRCASWATTTMPTASRPACRMPSPATACASTTTRDWRRAGGAGLLLVRARRGPCVGVTAGDLVDVARDDAPLHAALAGNGQGGGIEGGGGEVSVMARPTVCVRRRSNYIRTAP